MKYVILSDAHGNRKYFDECITHIDQLKADRIVYLGDAYGYFADGDYIIDELYRRNAVILKGNHEAMLLKELYLSPEKDQLYRLGDKRGDIDKKRLDYLKSLSPVYLFDICGRRCLCVHGSEEDPLNGYLYEGDVRYNWDSEYDYIFMGHTHRPYIKKVGHTTFVNVGSCGLPRDIGTAPSYCIIDDCSFDLKIVREQFELSILKDEYFAGIDERIMSVLRRKKNETY